MHAILKKTVLIVDDNQDAADALAWLIRIRGHSVHVSYRAKEGLAMARELVPDLIIHDIGMPELNGYEAAMALRAETAFRNTVLVALTGYGSSYDRETAIKAGFDHHCTKPLETECLGDVLLLAR